jgi:hypothetical protein
MSVSSGLRGAPASMGLCSPARGNRAHPPLRSPVPSGASRPTTGRSLAPRRPRPRCRPNRVRWTTTRRYSPTFCSESLPCPTALEDTPTYATVLLCKNRLSNSEQIRHITQIDHRLAVRRRQPDTRALLSWCSHEPVAEGTTGVP